jgi:prepilin signal peptidase PulO-like enzyme (type II secretory pathway)
MALALTILIGIFGLCFGSFFLVIIDRLPRGESFLKGRSHCDFCHKTLGLLDLVPVFSYIFLHGRCRYCHKPLPPSYVLFELGTGILFAQAAWYVLSHGMLTSFTLLALLYVLYLVSSLLLVFFIDLHDGIIPFSIVLPAIVLALFWQYFSTPSDVLSHLLSAVGSFGFFLLIFLATRGRGMGFGDVVFVFLLGMVLGFPLTIVALYIAFLTGAAVSLILILQKKKKLRGSTIPFGPFLVFGMYVCLFWGRELHSVFSHFFGI